ncbi:hypothetical protein JOF48_003041 [Arthrobacter stackebrandtii]|uniref:Uncharacterized protein n=1 Tax=Arthrobacter stackebrandtii TaxID=272161 RepID=A0ABS4YZM9_9MICC|nr:hypothetical protein [Arthrobacter stackebrandtii]
MLGFALGTGTIEWFKHLRPAELGPVAGVQMVLELATLRPRLTALADGSDPLKVQQALAPGMLAFDPADGPVYYVDDHFVPYARAKPVAKGWNTKRRHAGPGRDDTVLVDARAGRSSSAQGTDVRGLQLARRAHPAAGGDRCGRDDPARL